MNQQKPSPDDWDFNTDDDKNQWEVKRPASQSTANSEGQAIAKELNRFLTVLWHSQKFKRVLLFSLIPIFGIIVLICVLLGYLLNVGPFTPSPAPSATSVAIKPTTPASILVNNQPMPVATPNRIKLRNNEFSVNALTTDAKGQWVYDKNAKGAAFWASGTLINYVIGLHASPENKALFDSLAPNDLVELTTSAGTLRYRLNRVQSIKTDDLTLLRDQSAPQVTLMLMGDSGDQRRIAIAKYSDEGVPNALSPMRLPINLPDARVRVTGDKYVVGSSVGQAGKNFYQVNIELTNTSTRTLDAAQFVTQLIDANGVKYQVSPVASQAAGAPGWLQGQIGPGATLNATAGFDMPETIAGPKLEWTFATNPINGTPVARVSLPYRPPTVTAPAAPPVTSEVSVLNASFSPEGNELRVVGTVRNATTQPLNVTLRDVTLISGNTSSAVISSLPAMPWVVQPGETLAFQLNFNRPPGGALAILTILGQSFEIGGV
jgi:hypothetical protein